MRSAITLVDLIQRGFVKPGEGVLTIEYMVGGHILICEHGADALAHVAGRDTVHFATINQGEDVPR